LVDIAFECAYAIQHLLGGTGKRADHMVTVSLSL
jgi:thiamine pyrophosphokinase